jgi:transposase-like protein
VLAYGVHESGYREVIALDVGEAETEAVWRSFLHSLVERGLTRVQLLAAFLAAASSPSADPNRA